MSVRTLRFVQSKFHARWKGLVLDSIARKNQGRLMFVLPLYDKRGNRITRCIPRTIDEYWLEAIEPFDIEWVNPDWLKPTWKTSRYH